MVDLPKIKTELTGDISDLARAFIEAKLLRDAWLADTVSTMEKGGGDAGKKSAAALRKEFEQEIGRTPPDPTATEKFITGLDNMWKKSGASSARTFTGEWDRIMAEEGAGSGKFGRFVGMFDRWGTDAGDKFSTNFFSNIGNLFKGSNWTASLTDSGKKLGVDFSRGWIKGFMSVFDNPVTIGVGIPVIGQIVAEGLAGISGLTGTALGLAGIAAGIIGQLRDPQIKAAANQMWTDIKDTLTQSSTSFATPLMTTLDHYDQFLKSSGQSFTPIYQNLAGVLVPLEHGFEAFTTRILPGLVDGSSKFAPLVEQFSRELPEIGGALSDFLEKLTSSEGGNRAGLTAIIDLVDMLIRALGNLLQLGSHAFAGLIDMEHPVADWVDNIIGGFDRLIGKIPIVGAVAGWFGGVLGGNRKEVDKLYSSMHGWHSIAGTVTTDVNHLTQAAEKQATAVDKLLSSWDKFFGISMTLDQAVLTAKTGLLDYNDAIAKNGPTFDLSTRAGTDNYKMLLTQIANLKAVYDGEVAAGVSIPQATKEFQTQYDQLVKNAQQNGLTADQVQLINNQYGQLLAILDSLNGRDFHWSVSGPGGVTGGLPPDQFWRGVADGGGIWDNVVHAADGLLPARNPGTLVMAGELRTRGEWMIPRAGISQDRATALVGAAAADHGLSLGGGSATQVSVRVPLILNGRQFAEAIYEDLVAAAQTRKDRKGSTGLD